MRTLVHRSDLHFGRIDKALIEPLLNTVREVSPDLVVISGDLTQHARREQFLAARAFLDSLPQPQLVVPGNHDVPLYNVAARFFQPLQSYRSHISSELFPSYEDEEIAMMGINTARSFTRDRGSIDSAQVEHARRFFAGVDSRKIKIVVTHHPFDIPAELANKYVVRKAAEAMRVLSECQADLFLSGHAHLSFAETSVRRYMTAAHASLIVQAGTAISTRTRRMPNSFNVLRLERPRIMIEHWIWNRDAERFSADLRREFQHTSGGWTLAQGK